MAERWNPWNPWRTLRELDEVELWFAPLDGCRGLWVRSGGRDAIYLEETLGRRERREVLAHELVHVERGLGHPDVCPLLTAKDEARVWREALDRLAPPEAVEALRRRGEEGEPVTVGDVADELDLSADGVGRLIALLRATGRA
jgi:hypothetical protein